MASILRRTGDLRLCRLAPRAVAPPTRRPRRRKSAGDARLGAGAHTRQVDGSSVRALITSFRRRARLRQPPAEIAAGIRCEHPFAVIPSRSSKGSPACFGPDRSPPERSPGFRFLRARLRMRCPAGPSDRSSGLVSLTDRAGAAADLRSSARAGCRWRACRRVRSLLPANQVDRRDFCCRRVRS